VAKLMRLNNLRSKVRNKYRVTTVIGLYDRQVIGWSLSKTLFTKETITLAWKMARSKSKIDNNLIFHLDRGIKYASK
jgi:putative transposase